MRKTSVAITVVGLLVAVGLLVGLIASNGSCQFASTPAKTTELVIMVGNSFIPPTEQLIKEFSEKTGLKATYTTGGSEDLLPHVKARQQGDIFISNDPYLDYTKKAGSWSDHVQVGFVAPVLVVQRGNPKGIKSLTDLTTPGLKVALSNPEYSTCGEMVRTLLKKKKIYDPVMKNVGTRLTKGHSNLGNFIKTGTVDAVVMWNGVANTFKEHLDLVTTPYTFSWSEPSTAGPTSARILQASST